MFIFKVEDDKMVRRNELGEYCGFVKVDNHNGICRYINRIHKINDDAIDRLEKETKELKDKIESIRKIVNK